MKHAVIVAHPDPKSLNVSLARTYSEALRALGHETIVRDLYALGFDPCLKASEIPGPAAPRFAADVMRERALLTDIDVFAFVYPLWFNAPPAILKGYVDRVFGMGFGFNPDFGGMSPALGGRGLISITTSGAPEHWVRDTGAFGALTKLFDTHLAETCGLRIVDHVHIGGMVSDIGDQAYHETLKTVRDAVTRHFSA